MPAVVRVLISRVSRRYVVKHAPRTDSTRAIRDLTIPTNLVDGATYSTVRAEFDMWTSGTTHVQVMYLPGQWSDFPNLIAFVCSEIHVADWVLLLLPLIRELIEPCRDCLSTRTAHAARREAKAVRPLSRKAGLLCTVYCVKEPGGQSARTVELWPPDDTGH